MKMNVKLLLFIVPALAIFASGCGKYKQSASTDPMATATPTTTPTPLPPGSIPETPGNSVPVTEPSAIFSTGATTKFTPVSTQVFNQWVAYHPVEPKDVLINVALTKATNKKTYYGTVKIRYTSGGNTYQGNLKVDNTTYDNKDFYMFNYWFNYQGKNVFSGFFDDTVGGIVLIINNSTDLGDGQGATELSGEVWFKNYTASWAGYYEGSGWSVSMPCWFRSIGPYNCQTTPVMTKSALYPNNGYQKLGTFTNLNQAKAFAN
ncbi:MAG: hypothetical protein RJB66_1873 [Pseudomonadota bacterium]|jgi:hypothetical protein